MDLPERMRLRREELNMSQRELAAKLGYSTVGSNIYKIESGGNGLPLNKLCKLAEVLQTTPNWLLGWGGGVEISTFSGDETKNEGAVMPPRLDVYNSSDLTGEPVGAVYAKPSADLIAVKASSDSLAPDISADDIVIIDTSGRLRNNAIVLAEINNKTDFRRVLISDDVTLLISNDKTVSPEPLTARVKLTGTVVEIRKVIS